MINAKQKLIKVTVGLFAVVLGLYWLWSLFFPWIKRMGSDSWDTADLYILMISLFLSMFAIILIVCGIVLIFRMSESALKYIVGISSLAGAFCILRFLPDSFKSALGFLISLSAIFIYLLLAPFLLKIISGETVPRISLLNHGVITLAAWLFFQMLLNFSQRLFETSEGLSILAFIGSIIITYLLYRFTMRKIRNKIASLSF